MTCTQSIKHILQVAVGLAFYLEKGFKGLEDIWNSRGGVQQGCTDDPVLWGGNILQKAGQEVDFYFAIWSIMYLIQAKPLLRAHVVVVKLRRFISDLCPFIV